MLWLGLCQSAAITVPAQAGDSSYIHSMLQFTEGAYVCEIYHGGRKMTSVIIIHNAIENLRRCVYITLPAPDLVIPNSNQILIYICHSRSSLASTFYSPRTNMSRNLVRGLQNTTRMLIQFVGGVSPDDILVSNGLTGPAWERSARRVTDAIEKAVRGPAVL